MKETKIYNITQNFELNSIEEYPSLSPFIKLAFDILTKEPLVSVTFASSQSYVTPYAVIAVSNSAKQIDAITSNFIKQLKEQNLFNLKIKIDGNGERGWCIIDLINCFFHIMTEEKFAKYELEKILKGDYSENLF